VLETRVRAHARTVRPALLLALVLVAGWVSLAVVEAASLVPPAWPVSGLAAGLHLTTARRRRPWVLAALTVVVLVVHLAHGYPLAVATGFTLACTAETWLVRRTLLRDRPDGRAALLEEGDVSRLVGAIALGAAVAALGYGLTDLATGHGSAPLALVAVWGTHAASLMLLLPLFLPTPTFEPLARTHERLTQALLTLGTAALVFASASVPPIVFVVMPMFAWLAFRGTLREATLLLTLVATLGTVMTALGIGPVWGLGDRYGLAPEIVIGIMQLFLLDCGLIMLPLAVTVTQQRMTAARDAAGRETMERLVASATGTGIVATDPQGRITLFNPGAEAMLGHGADDVLGLSPALFHPADELARHAADLGTGPSYAEICAGLVASDEPRRLWRFTRKDGEERTMLLTVTAIPGDRGQLAGYLATAEDVTERESAQAALVLALERLQELDQVKSNFVSTVSHELRTPITSIIGYTELLEDGAGDELTPGQADLVLRVDRNSRRLLLLIEDLLTLSRIESADLVLDRVDTDLGDVATRAFDAVSAFVSQRDLTVTVHVPDEPVVLDGDPVQLERMVVNLLTNAVKFTPDGGRVDVSVAVAEGLARVVVADTGLGIPEAEQDRLFTRFFRSSTATDRAIQGTGLGLSIVHAIVTLHDGEIGIVSADRRGTTVTVTLPLQPARLPD
jgi:PAS domain S-box-containing protein